MLNQVTQLETVSRPYTSHSMYSMVSKKTPNQVEEQPKSPQLNIIAESKYGTFLDCTQNQAGSTWNVPPPPKKNTISPSVSKEEAEYLTRVETIKLEHYNMRTKALK